MEDRIARFMLRVSKFEFYLMNKNIEFAHLRALGELQKVEGVNWQKVALAVEGKFPFAMFDFTTSSFRIFRETAPQFLV